MDLNIVTLEIADLIFHFDYYDALVSDAIAEGANLAEEQTKIRNKSKKHLTDFLDSAAFYTNNGQLRPLKEIKDKLRSMKVADIHELIEKLEKDSKLIKKLYKANRKNH